MSLKGVHAIKVKGTNVSDQNKFFKVDVLDNLLKISINGEK